MGKCSVRNLTQPRPQGQAQERFVFIVPTLDGLKSEVGDCLHLSCCFLVFSFAERALSLFRGHKKATLTLVILNRGFPGLRKRHTQGWLLIFI
jgi:hypothetical protein